jgi:hypothetical protein
MAQHMRRVDCFVASAPRNDDERRCTFVFAGAAPSVVMPREGGASSTPRLLDFASLSLEYWIARSSRAMTVEGLLQT